MYAGGFFVLGLAVLLLTYGLAARSTRVLQVEPAPVVSQATPGGPGGFHVSPAGPFTISTHEADLKWLLGVSAIELILVTIGALAVGYIAAGRMLRPVRTITSAARTISAGNLHQRLALEGPDDEFKQLGDTLDELLARLEASFEAQRRFVANASHELRTPLTLERTLLQVALADPDADATKLRATCEELLATGVDQERLLEALLTLASSERGLERREPFDLAAVASHVLLTPPAELDELELHVDTSLESAPVSGDPARGERLVANLIDNAVVHNERGGRVRIRTGVLEGRAWLSVANTGEVIQPGEVHRLLEPFQRLGFTRGGPHDGHHGLGLSIVRAIADAHDATLTVDAQPSGGLAVTVTFGGGA